MTTPENVLYASTARPWLKYYAQKYIDQTLPTCSAFDYVCQQNKNRLGEAALNYYGRKFTYADFIVNVKKTAAALRGVGVKKGDIITVVSVMTPEVIYAFYAADPIAQQFSAYDTLFQKGQKLMNIMPPFIAYGYACGVHLPMVLGLTVVIIPNLDPAKLGSLVLKYKPEIMFGVPAHYQQLAADPKVQKKDLSFIHNYAAGGDAISLGAEKTVNEFLASHNVEYPMAKGYGMTEVASAATVAAGKNNKPGSVGIPMVNTLVSAFEPGTDKELPIGQRGELCISGPATMKGYYNKPDETAMILHKHPDGRVWVHTGDIGYIDEDGFVYLDSRIKRLIIRHDGFKVFPSMIENVVSQHPAVHQCSVVGCADKDHVQGRLPFVYIVLTPAAAGVKKKQLIQELRQMCEEELPEYVQPVAYKFVPELPMTPVGKVDYRKLEEEITPRDY